MEKQEKIKRKIVLENISRENANSLGLTEKGNGTFGICYLDETTNTIYKLFKAENYAPNFIQPYSLEKLKKLSNDIIAFPQKIIKRSSNIIGVSYKYIDGETLNNFITSNKEIYANKFIEYYKLLITIIPYLKDNNVGIFDLNLGNIIINDKGFYIIDTDPWNVSEYDDYVIENIWEINSVMIEFISYSNFIFEDLNNIIKNIEEFKLFIRIILHKIPIDLNLGELIFKIQKLIKKANSYDELTKQIDNLITDSVDLIPSLCTSYIDNAQKVKKYK